MVVTLSGGTLGFVLIDHYPVFDAFYMTLTTVTTVGYGEIHPLSRAGRVFNSFLILGGVITMLLAIGAMTQIVIELELNQFFGKRRVKSMIDKLEGHIILCGFGRVGRGAADELQQSGVPFVVVDKNEDKVELAMRAGMLAVLADASRDETLLDVGIEKAKGLIASLASDADNLFVILSAKTLNPRLATLGARCRGDFGAEAAARRRGLRDRALQQHRPPHGAGYHQTARPAVSGLHHQQHGPRRGHRTGAGGRGQRVRWKNTGRHAGAAGNRGDRARDPQGGWTDALQSSGGGANFQRRSFDRHGRTTRPAPSGGIADGGARMMVLTAEQIREVDRLTIEGGVPSLALMENAAHRVEEALAQQFDPLHEAVRRGAVRKGEQWRRRAGAGAAAER